MELFQIFKKQNVYEPNFATPIFFKHIFWERLVRGVQILEPVGKKLLGRHALGGDFCMFVFARFSPKKTNEKNMGNKQNRKKKKIVYRGLILSYHRGKGPLGGTLAICFHALLELFQIFKKQNVYEPNFATPIFLKHVFLGKIGKRGSTFEPVGKKLLGRHALGGDFGGLFLYLGFLGLNLEIWSGKK